MGFQRRNRDQYRDGLGDGDQVQNPRLQRSRLSGFRLLGTKLNDFQLTGTKSVGTLSVPEPSSLVVLGNAGLAGLAYVCCRGAGRRPRRD